MVAERVLKYTVAGDPRARGYLTFEAALSLAITIAEQRPTDGEEYRHGVLLNGNVIGAAIRHSDGSITARRYSSAADFYAGKKFDRDQQRGAPDGL